MNLRTACFFSFVTVVSIGSFARPLRADGSECVKASEEGTAARDRGRLREARQRFVSCAADTCPKPLRIDCARWLEDVESSLPTVVFGARDPKGDDLFDVDVFVDGERVSGHEQGKALALDPGPHIVRFDRPKTGKTAEVKVLLRAGERNRPVIATIGGEAEPGPRAAPANGGGGSSVSIPALVVGGVGVLALGSFAYFAIQGSDEKDRLEKVCSPRCNDAQVSDLRADYIIADVSLGVGIVALGLATWLWLSHERSPAVSSAQGRFARTIWK